MYNGKLSHLFQVKFSLIALFLAHRCHLKYKSLIQVLILNWWNWINFYFLEQCLITSLKYKTILLINLLTTSLSWLSVCYHLKFNVCIFHQVFVRMKKYSCHLPKPLYPSIIVTVWSSSFNPALSTHHIMYHHVLQSGSLQLQQTQELNWITAPIGNTPQVKPTKYTVT